MRGKLEFFFETANEVGLVVKAAFKSNLGSRFFSCTEFGRCPAKSHSADVRPKITAKIFRKVSG